MSTNPSQLKWFGNKLIYCCGITLKQNLQVYNQLVFLKVSFLMKALNFQLVLQILTPQKHWKPFKKAIPLKKEMLYIYIHTYIVIRPMVDLFSLSKNRGKTSSPSDSTKPQTGGRITSCFIAWSACNADLNCCGHPKVNTTQGSMCDK